jgi:HSF-type DNA-binding
MGSDDLSIGTSNTSVPPLLPDNGDGLHAQDATLYKYRDFSNIAEDGDDVAEVPPPMPTTRGNMESSIRVQKFPVKLYVILAQKEFHDIITWLPHGRSWKVLKPSVFESMVMPLFFEYSNYHSFNRLVNAWSFRRVSSGPDRGSYYHEVSDGISYCYTATGSFFGH